LLLEGCCSFLEALGDIIISLLFQVAERKHIVAVEDRELRSLSLASNSRRAVLNFYMLSALPGFGITFSIFKANKWMGRRTVSFFSFPCSD
jgi:hypothetical protein